MRAVVQRVSRAQVSVGGEVVGAIGPGLCVLVAAGAGDDRGDLDYVVGKVVHLRIFEDADGKMNRSVLDTGGEALIISQFTLYGDTRKGRRPAFTGAMEPAAAEQMYDDFVAAVRAAGVSVATGVFRAMMDVELVNSGPVTILIDSKKSF